MPLLCFFFFNDTATTEIYTLSLHDALPILPGAAEPDHRRNGFDFADAGRMFRANLVKHLSERARRGDRKSTRLNSSHANISYAVFCLKKKTNTSVTGASRNSPSRA